MKHYIEHKKRTLFTLTVLWLFVSCGSNKNIAIVESSIKSEPKIIFLNYNIKKVSDESRIVQFVNKKEVNGKLKKTNNTEEGVIGDLICTQLDKNSNTLQHFVIKNPLVKNIEYVNDYQSFKIKQINLDSAQFSVRLQLKSNTKYISISDFNNTKNHANPLIKTTIN